jgi:glycosyltransferase involved in cell wall biosynthesis
MKKPLVSVIIPTCDRWTNLIEAIKSVKAQTFDDYEIIVVNDGSISLGDKLNIAGVKLVEDGACSSQVLGFGSGGYSRNKGIKAATGQYIAFLDDDDQFYTNKLSEQIDLMRRNKWRVSCAEANIGIFKTKKFFSNTLHSDFYRSQLIPFLKIVGYDNWPAAYNYELLNLHNFVITSSVVLERSIFEEVGFFENIPNGGGVFMGKMDFEDWELWRRVAKVSDFHYINKPLLYYKRGSLKKVVKKLRNLIITGRYSRHAQ